MENTKENLQKIADERNQIRKDLDKKAKVKPKKIAEMQMSGEVTPEAILNYLEKDINTCLQILYVIRESQELKEAMAAILHKKFTEKPKDHK